jgi:FtsH-binding integral membrane protein
MKGFNSHFIYHALGFCLAVTGIIFIILVLNEIGILKKFGIYPVAILGIALFVLGFYLMYKARKVFSREEKSP